jgi:hypothetical protein
MASSGDPLLGGDLGRGSWIIPFIKWRGWLSILKAKHALACKVGWMDGGIGLGKDNKKIDVK